MANKLTQDAYQARYGLRPYWLGLLIAADQAANAVLWGYTDETLSSRAFRCSLGPRPKQRWVLARAAIDRLFWWDRQAVGDREIRHCELAFLGELAREHLPGEFRVL